MKTLAYHFMNKGNWPPGIWHDEPDKMQWQDVETKLPCLAVRNDAGFWCGYVGVDAYHPLFHESYDFLENIDVHGGLTFSGKCSENDKEHGICHLPDKGETDNITWFGFDCAHSGDFIPAFVLTGWKFDKDCKYRTLEFVQKECRKLAKQLYAYK